MIITKIILKYIMKLPLFEAVFFPPIIQYLRLHIIKTIKSNLSLII